MTFSVRHGNTRHASGLLAITIAVLLAAFAPAIMAPAAAQDTERAQLGVKPVGVDGSYFELTMSPGESRQLTVEFGNFGTRDAVAMTYPADVYSLVNGGMGVRLAGEPTSGATAWIGFEAETVPLAAGEGQLRSFAVSLPADAAPGEYITSIVIQDATPAMESTAASVATNRVTRQAIAVAITVPGPIVPALTLGSVEHHVAGGRSVITVEIANSGNVRLKPSGELVLSNASGGEPTRFPVAMDSVYAGTSTIAEIPFATLLNPGDYIAVFSLANASRAVTATTPMITLSVPAPSVLRSTPASAASLAATMSQPPVSGDGGRTGPRLSLGGSTPLAAALVAGMLALGLSAVVVSRRVAPRATTRAARSQREPVCSPPAMMARQVTIRQLNVPQRRHVPSTSERPRTEAPRFERIVVSEVRSRFPATSSNSHLKGA